jgi:hypothetical protein
MRLILAKFRLWIFSKIVDIADWVYDYAALKILVDMIDEDDYYVSEMETFCICPLGNECKYYNDEKCTWKPDTKLYVVEEE